MELINNISLEAYILIGLSIIIILFGFGFKLIREQYKYQKEELNRYRPTYQDYKRYKSLKNTR